MDKECLFCVIVMAYNKIEPLKNLIVFDIETIPDTSLAGELCDINEQELEKKTQQELRQAMENYHTDHHKGNAFLRQPFHRVACISFLEASIVYENEYADDITNTGKEDYKFQQLTSYSSFNCTEEEVIRKFWGLLQEKKPRIVSFNGYNFDMNVLKCKALKYGIDCSWYFNYGGKWDGYESRYPNRANQDIFTENFGDFTLHEICILLNIPCKLGVDGSRVAEYFDDKKYNEIREYCETDVLATYLVYLRMALVKGWINKNAYNKSIEDVENHLISQQDKKKGLKEFLEAWHKLNPNGIKM